MNATIKTMTLVFGLLLASVGRAKAYEVEGNPDKRISLGFNYDRASENSEYSFRGATMSDFTKISGDSFILDTRIPLNSFFTFSVRGGLTKSDNDIFTGEKISYSGYDIGFGVRLYLK